MKNWVRYTVGGVTLAAFSAGIVLLCMQVRASRHLTTCSGVEVGILDDFRFVTEDEIRNCITGNIGPVIGQRLDSMKLSEIEKAVNMESAVLESQAWTSADGRLHVELTQRMPVIRFLKGDKGFYVDRTGFIFPLFEGFDSQIPQVSGCLPLAADGVFRGQAPDAGERRWLSEMVAMVRFMEEDGDWFKMVSGISVLQSGDLELTLKDCTEKFVFGRPEKVKARFALLDEYLRTIRPLKEEGYYSTVILKYQEQIICRR